MVAPKKQIKVMNHMDICRLCLAENVEMFRINEDISKNLTYYEFSHQIADLPIPSPMNKNVEPHLICESCRKFCQEILKFRFMILTNLECLQKQFILDEKNEDDGGEEEIEYEIEAINPLHIKNMTDDVTDGTEDLIEETIINSQDDIIEANEFSGEEDYFQETITKIERFECPTKSCLKTFSSERGLKRHGVMHSDLFIWIGKDDVDTINCIICGVGFMTKTELCEHKKEHRTFLQNESGIINCRYCQKPHKSITQLTNHLKNHDETKNFSCTLCYKKFSEFGHEIQDHISVHEGSVPHICICGKTFNHATQLSNHMRIHSSDSNKEFLCFECGKAFNRKANLTQHLLRHRGYKKYPCDRCPAKFSSNGNLKAHKKSHLDEKPFKCDICGSAFKQNYSLAKHKKVIHAGERKYQCEYCDMKFNTSDHLKRHTRTHTGEKPYNCEYCQKSFTQNGDLNKHKRVHLGENTYKCEENGCGESFRLRKDLRNHYYEHFKTM